MRDEKRLLELGDKHLADRQDDGRRRAMRAGGRSARVAMVDDGGGTQLADSEAAAQRRQVGGTCRSRGETGSTWLQRGWGPRAGALVGLACVVAVALLPGSAAAAARDGSNLDAASAAGDWARHHERRSEWEHRQQLESGSDNGSPAPWKLRSFTKEEQLHTVGGSRRAGFTGWSKTWTGTAFEWRWMADGSLIQGSVDDSVQLTEWHDDTSGKSDKSDKSDKSSKDDVDFGYTESEPADSKGKSSDKSSGKSSDEEDEETCDDYPDTILKLPWGVAVRFPPKPSHCPTSLLPGAQLLSSRCPDRISRDTPHP